MSDLNKVCLLGRVGRDPEIRYTQGGEPIANFSLATSERWKGKDGQKQERTEWFRVDVFGKLAETVRDYVSKGKQLYLEGSLHTDEWQDKDGNKRQTTKVRLSGPRAVLILLGSKGDRREPEDTRTPGISGSTPADDFQVSDDDVPF